jgi:hypothetical protein
LDDADDCVDNQALASSPATVDVGATRECLNNVETAQFALIEADGACPSQTEYAAYVQTRPSSVPHCLDVSLVDAATLSQEMRTPGCPDSAMCLQSKAHELEAAVVSGYAREGDRSYFHAPTSTSRQDMMIPIADIQMVHAELLTESESLCGSSAATGIGDAVDPSQEAHPLRRRSNAVVHLKQCLAAAVPCLRWC